jgi:plastocyanin
VRAGKVEIGDFSYEPDPITIQAGGKVIWINRDSEPHTATGAIRPLLIAARLANSPRSMPAS